MSRPTSTRRPAAAHNVSRRYPNALARVGRFTGSAATVSVASRTCTQIESGPSFGVDDALQSTTTYTSNARPRIEHIL